MEPIIERTYDDGSSLREDVAKRFAEEGALIAKHERLAPLQAVQAPFAASGGYEASDAPSFLSRGSPNGVDVAGVGVVDAKVAVAAFSASFPVAPRIVLVDQFNELPQQVQDDARSQKSGDNDSKGLYHCGAIYLIRADHSDIADFQATLAHEAFGHYGMRRTLGPEFMHKANQLFVRLGGLTGLAQIAKRRGFDKTFAAYVRGAAAARAADPVQFNEQTIKAILTDDVLAHIAERAEKEGPFTAVRR